MGNISENSSIVKIGDLTSEYRFFVPSYQRGYRWTTEDVNNLLDDLYDFYGNPSNNILLENSNMYCLQPLMVKLREDDTYEVIDGQQRLTTVYIILKMIDVIRNSNLLLGVQKNTMFSIEYETRKDSADYLKNIKLINERETSNIDYYYFSNTAIAFIEWLKKSDDIDGRLSAISTMLKKKTFFIWYELPKDTKQSELFELFKKVNVGKIQLTDGELIKALLINKDNFAENPEKRQEEIAISWDRIEQNLREDEFWYFFNEYKKDAEKDTRIDIIFELIAKRINKSEKYNISESEKRFVFLVIAKHIDKNKQNKEKIINQIWQEVEFIFAELRFWYKKNDLYHIIGYLIAAKQKNIFEIWDAIEGKRKSEQLKALISDVKYSIRYEKLQIDEFEYKITKREYIRNLLLLHNIATIVIKKDKEIRFPFEIMKKRAWDIEHIHALNDDTEETDNSIANLALLDAKINREYKDAPYIEKRKTILEYDMDGRFIPLCTKFVFYKMYTSEEDKKKADYNADVWNDYDKEAYVENMKKIITEFFDTEWR